MKHLYLILCFLNLPFSILSQTNSILDGEWEGFIDIQDQRLSISLIFNTADHETDGAINIPQQASFDLPVEVPYLTADSLAFSFETGTGSAIFRASLDERSPDEISGLFQQSGIEYPFTIIKQHPDSSSSPGNLTEEDHTIETDSHTIAGSLVSPEVFSDSTLVILVSGSGAQTRNSPVAGFEIFKKLSYQLADHGYFSFRYDDRGRGGSTGATDATLSELAEDLKEVMTYFSDGMHTNRFSSIVFLGHSQGGLVSLLAANDVPPQKLVLLATPMLPGDEVINQQIRVISETQEVSEEVVQQNLEFQKKVYEAARTGNGWDELEEDIADRLRDQINELPEAQRNTLGDMDQFIRAQVNRQLDGAKTSWFKSFIETDPRSALKELRVPVLALFGEHDKQVLPEENFHELEPYQNNVQAMVIPRANHLFQISETGMPDEYGTLEPEFTEILLNEIIRFLETHSTSYN